MQNFSETSIIFGAKYLIFLLGILFVCFFIKQPQKIRKQMFVFAVLTMPLTYVIAKLSSLFFYNPRPFVAGDFLPLIPHANDNGFPSDHTLLGAALAMVALAFNKKIGGMFLALAFLVGISRVLASVHHTADILGSVFIAAFVSYIAYKFLLPFAAKFMK